MVRVDPLTVLMLLTFAGAAFRQTAVTKARQRTVPGPVPQADPAPTDRARPLETLTV